MSDEEAAALGYQKRHKKVMIGRIVLIGDGAGVCNRQLVLDYCLPVVAAKQEGCTCLI